MNRTMHAHTINRYKSILVPNIYSTGVLNYTGSSLTYIRHKNYSKILAKWRTAFIIRK